MSLIVYLSGTKESNEKLMRIIRDALPGAPLEVYLTIGELTRRLRQPFPDVNFAVLYAASRAELMEIIFLEKILGELRLVLILPDRDPEIMEKAHRLRPRYVAVAPDDYDRLQCVLQRSMELYGPARME
jgi:hypothetical protein